MEQVYAIKLQSPLNSKYNKIIFLFLNECLALNSGAVVQKFLGMGYGAAYLQRRTAQNKLVLPKIVL